MLPPSIHDMELDLVDGLRVPQLLDQGTCYTYDDIIFHPGYINFAADEVKLGTNVTKNIAIRTPIVSSPMDTVTESNMAIAMAREGGIGVIHKNMTIKEQVENIRKVKRSESGMIMDPIVLYQDSKVGDAKESMSQNKIGGIPIVDSKRKLIGIVTNRDLRFENNKSRPIKEVMTVKNLITVNKGTSLKDAEEILQKHKIEKLPVIDKNNNLVGLITFRDVTKHLTKPNSNKDKYGRLVVAAAIGVNNDSEKRAEALVESNVDALVIDTAHAHSKGVSKVLLSVRKKFPKIDIVVGNIATYDGARFLIDQGVDGVKVGIGPGSICTTRVIAGVGYPQLSAIIDVSRALKDSEVPMIADGGIRYTGDIPKAIAAGADSVMLGGLIAGTQESPGETIIFEGRKFKSYRGMGSVEAMKKGSKDRYFQDVEDDIKKLVPEGIVGRVPYKGELIESIHQFVGGLRSGMGYCGAKNINLLKKEAKFISITPSGIRESHPHNITITKEAPNYSP